MSFLSEEDKNLFREAVKGATKLQGTQTEAVTQHHKAQGHHRLKLAIKRPKYAKTHAQIDEWALYAEGENGSYELEHSPSRSQVGAFESILYQKNPLKPTALKKLKQGLFHTHWTLDLHGETLESADKILRQFIQEAHFHQARYLIIVHGKGYHSETDTPVLKNLVNQRLRQFPFVLAFCSAQPKDGGTGAVYVFLKKTNESKD